MDWIDLMRVSSALVVSGTVLIGCIGSGDSLGRSWVGAPVKRLERGWGLPDDITHKPDGSTERKYIADTACTFYFTVDSTEIITGYRFDGWCDPPG